MEISLHKVSCRMVVTYEFYDTAGFESLNLVVESRRKVSQVGYFSFDFIISRLETIATTDLVSRQNYLSIIPTLQFLISHFSEILFHSTNLPISLWENRWLTLKPIFYGLTPSTGSERWMRWEDICMTRILSNKKFGPSQFIVVL